MVILCEEMADGHSYTGPDTAQETRLFDSAFARIVRSDLGVSHSVQRSSRPVPKIKLAAIGAVYLKKVQASTVITAITAALTGRKKTADC